MKTLYSALINIKRMYERGYQFASYFNASHFRTYDRQVSFYYLKEGWRNFGLSQSPNIDIFHGK